MADSSFDVVSKLDRQEVDNAVNQTAKEIANRYDFRGVDAAITLSGDTIAMEANSASRVMAILDVLQSKLIRRGLSLKVLDYKDREPKASGKLFKLACPLKEGIPQDTAKKISKLIREEGPKGVKAQIQGDELRVSSKSRDDLQAVITLLKGPKGEELDVAVATMSRGPLGAVSRLSGAVFGSALTFATAGGAPSAPGQLPIDRVRAVLDLLPPLPRNRP